MYDIYNKCPQFSTEVITLRLTSREDTEEMLKCYSDKKAVLFSMLIIAMETIFIILHWNVCNRL